MGKKKKIFVYHVCKFFAFHKKNELGKKPVVSAINQVTLKQKKGTGKYPGCHVVLQAYVHFIHLVVVAFLYCFCGLYSEASLQV